MAETEPPPVVTRRLDRSPASIVPSGPAFRRVLHVLHVLRALPAILLLTAGAPRSARAEGPEASQVAAFRKDPIRFLGGALPGETIACGQAVLSDASATPDEKRAALVAVGAAHLAANRRGPARAAFLEILGDDPAAELPRAAELPPAAVRFFYSVRDSALLADGKSTPVDVRTIAVGEIENNSIVAGEFDLDHFARGLSQVIVNDLMGATPLRVVDRQRLAVLRDEIGMSQSAFSDPKYRVAFGRLTGAQSFLFGSLLAAPGGVIRLDLRWVDTSTGEVLLSDGVESKVHDSNDLFGLEKKVFLDLLVPRIRETLGDAPEAKDLGKTVKPYLEARRKAVPKESSRLDLLLRTGEALIAEDRGDLGAARSAWAEVSRLDPGDPFAAGRVAALAGAAAGKETPR